MVKAGADARVYRVHGLRPSNGAGTFSFTPGFTQGPDPTRAGPTSGHAFASYLLGTPASGNIAVQPTQDFQQYYVGISVQDDWKLSQRLTINLGLRYEIESFRTDRFDRLTYLDFGSRSPIQAPSLGREVRGGLAFAGVNGNPRPQAATSFNNWGPRRIRIHGAQKPGAAWRVRRLLQPAHMARHRIRAAGFRIRHSVCLLHRRLHAGERPSIAFPRRVYRAHRLLTRADDQRRAGDQRAGLPQASPYVQQWNFGTQTTLPGSILLEVAYAGSKGTRLMQNIGFNQIADEYLSLGSALLQQVPNPFQGQIPANTALGRGTVSRGQLLRPHPQFTNVSSVRSTSGSYRLFTRKQLILLSALTAMLDTGIAPRIANVYIELIAASQLDAIAFDYIVFARGDQPYSAPSFVRRRDWQELQKAVGHGAFVLDYKGIVAHVDSQIPHLSAMGD